AALVVPGVGRARAPEAAAAGVGNRPAQRRVVRVAGVVVAGVQLDAVTVGVAQVDEEGVGHPVAAGTALDRVHVAGGGELVADAQDAGRLGQPHREVVQARAGPGGQRDVVDGRLAPQPRAGQLLVVAVGRDVLRGAEAHL